jgi:FkbM family methyltransferase
MKSLIKALVPAHAWVSMSWWRERFGAASALATHAPLLLGSRRLLRVPATIAGHRAHVNLRPGTTDLDVFDEILLQGEYDIDLGQPRRIVDAGAHIGLGTMTFALRHPQAEVIALEPEPGNFELLKLNTAHLPNVRCIQAGLWSRTSDLRIVDVEHSTWGFRVEEAPPGSGIRALGMGDVLAQFCNRGPLALKIDIEGSEVELFSTSEAWIDQADSMVIELHDRFRPGCTAALDAAVQGRGFERSVSGESIVLRRPALAAARPPAANRVLAVG